MSRSLVADCRVCMRNANSVRLPDLVNGSFALRRATAHPRHEPPANDVNPKSNRRSNSTPPVRGSRVQMGRDERIGFT